MDDNQICRTCPHTHYDHIGWRAEWDKKVNCRVIGCGCEAFQASVVMRDESYFSEMRKLYVDREELFKQYFDRYHLPQQSGKKITFSRYPRLDLPKKD